MVKDEILNFFKNNPRFNIAILKGALPDPEELSKTIGFPILDIKEEILTDKIKLYDAIGYADMVEIIKKIAGNHYPGIVIKDLDILLCALDRDKRESFFEKVLSTRFKSNIVLCISIFKADIPYYEDYNHGLVLSGG